MHGVGILQLEFACLNYLRTLRHVDTIRTLQIQSFERIKVRDKVGHFEFRRGTSPVPRSPEALRQPW